MLQTFCEKVVTYEEIEGERKTRLNEGDTGRRIETNIFTYKHVHTYMPHTTVILHIFFTAPTLLHTIAFTHQHCYTQTLLHADAFTQTLLHRDSFTHKHFKRRRFYVQSHLHASTFTHKHLYAQTLYQNQPNPQKKRFDAQT